MYLEKEWWTNMQSYLICAKKEELFAGRPIFCKGLYSKFMTIYLRGIHNAYKIKTLIMP